MRSIDRDLRESRLAAWTELHRRVEADLQAGQGHIHRAVRATDVPHRVLMGHFPRDVADDRKRA